jgi:hypothetical protein
MLEIIPEKQDLFFFAPMVLCGPFFLKISCKDVKRIGYVSLIRSLASGQPYHFQP